MPSFSWGPFCGYVGEGHLWFRIFGYGVHVKDTHRAPLLFSERHGYQGFALGRLYVRPLRGYDIPPKVSTHELGSDKIPAPPIPEKKMDFVYEPPGGPVTHRLKAKWSLDTEGPVLAPSKTEGRPDGKDGHYIFNAYTYKGRMRPPYAIIAKREAKWVVIGTGILKLQEAQDLRAQHCKKTPETWTWVGPGNIAAWAVASGKDPNTYKPRRPKKAKKRGRK